MSSQSQAWAALGIQQRISLKHRSAVLRGNYLVVRVFVVEQSHDVTGDETGTTCVSMHA